MFIAAAMRWVRPGFGKPVTTQENMSVVYEGSRSKVGAVEGPFLEGPAKRALVRSGGNDRPKTSITSERKRCDVERCGFLR